MEKYHFQLIKEYIFKLLFFHCYLSLPVYQTVSTMTHDFATSAPRNLQEVHQSNQVHWDKVKSVSTAPRNTCPAPDVGEFVPHFFAEFTKQLMNHEVRGKGNKDPPTHNSILSLPHRISSPKLNHEPRSTGLELLLLPGCFMDQEWIRPYPKLLPPFITYHFFVSAVFDSIFFSHRNPNYPHNLTRNTKIT